jgi:hypothetical protein
MTSKCQLIVDVSYDEDQTNLAQIVSQLQDVLQTDYVTDRVVAALFEVAVLHTGLNESGEYEFADGSCLQLDDDQSVRFIDQYGNSGDIRSPGDEGYDEWRKCFPKPKGFESADATLFHLTPQQIQKLFDAATDIIVAGDGYETVPTANARETAESSNLDELLALFPGDVADYRKRGIDFDPNTGEAWEDD